MSGGYETMSGTSMATPHVAGAAALYMCTHRDASPAQVKTALQRRQPRLERRDDPDGIHEPLLNVDAF